MSPTDFTALGFDLGGEDIKAVSEGLVRLWQAHLDECLIAPSESTYRYCCLPLGEAELWSLTVNGRLSPAYSEILCTSANTLEVDGAEWVAWDKHDMAGLLSVYHGDNSLYVAVPNARMLAPLSPARSYLLSASFLAMSARAFPDREDFHREFPDMTVPSVLPMGAYAQKPDSACAVIGIVERCERRTNHLTGKTYYCITLEQPGCSYTVYASPESLEQIPAAGEILSAVCRLRGKIIG